MYLVCVFTIVPNKMIVSCFIDYSKSTYICVNEYSNSFDTC